MERGKIVEACIGCTRIDGEYCKAYMWPSTKWKPQPIGGCPLATHVQRAVKEVKVFVDPLKASKQKSKGRR